MNARKIFLGSLLMTVLPLGIAVVAWPNGATAETECQKFERKHKPAVDRFVKEFVNVPVFNAKATLLAMQDDASRLKYQRLDPNKRRAVWQAKFDNLERFDGTGGSRFTDAQWAFIELTRSEIKDQKFDGTDDPGYGRERTAQMKGIFADRLELAISLFGSLQATPALMNARFSAVATCSCDTQADFCIIGKRCGVQLPYCTTSWGCGWWWNGICDGECLNNK